ncbi:hypothetical protein JOAD_9 [Erwinia phage vB_EamM_Joad]|uniref:Uncharacterized protein n=1 Tax=Erwinia phage vB_EamM_Joad TaxID=2026081 RepID=A0A223LJY9_9CAUD|nr:hypothetical protein JOAD_9 [Erwinia phage vB_EamM_Joad]
MIYHYSHIIFLFSISFQTCTIRVNLNPIFRFVT